MTRREVIYSGRVQGVGFRATVTALARGTSVTGYVRNTPDGGVEMIVEGTPAELDDLMARIARHFDGYIEDVQRSDTAPRGEFREFGIRY
ncbi:MAG: acylphosphatase [Phycisphaerae bacterium]|nr:acylphosphatase [Phycisphaerae bacterium]NUQ46449.1 acylphosphatase [Phycisphaerae bacterium]